MSRVLSVLNEVVYPGSNDKPGQADDCWAVATIWAARAALGLTHLPTIVEFRAAAHRPEEPKPSGGYITDIMRASASLWPGKAIQYSSPGWTPFVDALKAGATASLAVSSAKLPANLRFGFWGLHQVGVAWQDGQLVVANPLAPNGSAPIPMSEAALHTAAAAYKDGWILAALYPETNTMRNFHVLTGADGTLTTGTVVVKEAGHSYLRLVDDVLVAAGAGMTKQGVAVRLTEDCPGKPTHAGQDRRTGWLVGDLAAFLLATDVAFTPEATGDAAAARKAGYAQAKANAITAVEAI